MPVLHFFVPGVAFSTMCDLTDYLKNLPICYRAGEHLLRNIVGSSSCLTSASHNQRLLLGKYWRVFRQLDQKRIGEGLDKMTVLPKEVCNTVKNTADLLFFVCVANKDSSSGQVISDCLVLSLLGK